MGLGLGLMLWGSMVGHPSNSWASCYGFVHHCETAVTRAILSRVKLTACNCEIEFCDFVARINKRNCHGFQ